MKASDLEYIALLYDRIRHLLRSLKDTNDKKLAEDFDQHLKRVMHTLSQSLGEDKADRQMVVVGVKKELIAVCEDKMGEYLDRTGGECGEVMAEIRAYKERLWEAAMRKAGERLVEGVEDGREEEVERVANMNKKLEE